MSNDFQRNTAISNNGGGASSDSYSAASESVFESLCGRETRSHHLRSGFLAGLGTGFFATIGLFLVVGWLLSSSMAVAFQPIETEEKNSRDPNRQRSVREIRKDIEAFVKNSKQKQDLSLQVGSILDLCQLHHEIVNDTRFNVGTKFKSFRARVATRLKAYKKQLELDMTRRKRAAERAEKLAARAASKDRELNLELTASERAEAASDPESTSGQGADEWDQILNRSMFEMGSLSGGPSELFGYLGGSYAPPWDYGEDLVRLIERTISPDTWLRNGGNGRIHYYRPSMVIVVSASGEVHDQMTDLLRQMRFLGR